MQSVPNRDSIWGGKSGKVRRSLWLLRSWSVLRGEGFVYVKHRRKFVSLRKYDLCKWFCRLRHLTGVVVLWCRGQWSVGGSLLPFQTYDARVVGHRHFVYRTCADYMVWPHCESRLVTLSWCRVRCCKWFFIVSNLYCLGFLYFIFEVLKVLGHNLVAFLYPNLWLLIEWVAAEVDE